MMAGWLAKYALAAGLAAVVVPAPALADDWAVNRIRYENRGGYAAFVDVGYIRSSDGKKKDCQGKNSGEGRWAIAVGGSKTVRLDPDNGDLKNTEKTPCGLSVGDEVWGIVFIEGLLQKFKSCRKKNAKFYYHPDGGTVTIFTKGTTENNNRCRLRDNGGVRYEPE